MPATLPPLDARTRLALDRTFLAHERTMMAWVRTAASMISFGFTIYKFFQLELGDRQPAVRRLIGPREFALLLIAIGLGSLTLAFIEHSHTLHRLRTDYAAVLPRSIAGIVAAIVASLGSLAILVVLLRQ